MEFKKLSKTSFLIIFLVTVGLGLTAGGAFAAHTVNSHHGTVVLSQDAGVGNFFLQDGFMSLTGRSDGTPSQIIDAKSSPGNQAVFRVTGDGGNAFFTIASTGGTPTLFLKDADNPQEYLFRIAQPDTGRLDIVDNTAGVSRMSFTNTGNVGIGTTSPDAALHVRAGNSDISPNQNGVQITGSDVAGNSAIELTTDSGEPYIDFTNGFADDFHARLILKDDAFEMQSFGRDLKINKAGNDVILNENAGNVGIGTASPATKLHLVGDMTIESQIFCDGCVTPATLKQPSLRFLGPVGDPVGTGYSIGCAPGSVAVGMDGRSAAAIDDVRLLCKEIIRPSIGQFIDPVFSDATTPTSTASGAIGGSPFSFTCPGTDQGQGVAVGMKFWEDTVGPDFTIEGIQLRCINVETGALSSSPIFGVSTGFTSGTFNNCINNRMLAGLDGDHGPAIYAEDTINSMRLICR